MKKRIEMFVCEMSWNQNIQAGELYPVLPEFCHTPNLDNGSQTIDKGSLFVDLYPKHRGGLLS